MSRSALEHRGSLRGFRNITSAPRCPSLIDHPREIEREREGGGWEIVCPMLSLCVLVWVTDTSTSSLVSC